MTAKETKVWSVDIDRSSSVEIIVKAKNMTEAKKRAWERFANRKPKKKDHHIYADNITCLTKK